MYSLRIKDTNRKMGLEDFSIPEVEVIRVNKYGERFPITIAGAKPENGLVRIYVAEVGASSRDLCALREGESILNFSGPLGNTSPIKNYGTIVIIGNAAFIGAQLYVTKSFKKEGNKIISVVSSKREEELFLIDELDDLSDEIFIIIEDGSEGHSFFNFLDPYFSEKKVDYVFTIGSTSMQKIISEKTRPFSIPTRVNLFPIMVDGTGMCGACRVSVAGVTRFACVDGPDFDGHQVDFDELIDSIRKIMHYPNITNDFIIYPGHGGKTTIGDEKKNNKYRNYFL